MNFTDVIGKYFTTLFPVSICIKIFFFVTVLPAPVDVTSSTFSVILVQSAIFFSYSVVPFYLHAGPLLHISHLQPAVKPIFNLSSFSSYMVSHSFFFPIDYTFPSQQAHVCIISFVFCTFCIQLLCPLWTPFTLHSVPVFSLFITIAYSLNKYIAKSCFC